MKCDRCGKTDGGPRIKMFRAGDYSFEMWCKECVTANTRDFPGGKPVSPPLWTPANPLTLYVGVDRTHEERMNCCAKESANPPACAGHMQGPVACPRFTPIAPTEPPSMSVSEANRIAMEALESICAADDAAEAARAAAGPGKDKAMIWDDCAECAHKHLSASVAMLTSGLDLGYAADDEILLARAMILTQEYRAGYLGNLDLAVGCLAMAELSRTAPAERRESYRQARLAISRGGESVNYLEALMTWPSPAAWAAAHLIEACRELPAVADRICLSRWLHADGFSNLGDGTDGGDKVDILETLKKAIHWVWSCYELRGGK